MKMDLSLKDRSLFILSLIEVVLLYRSCQDFLFTFIPGHVHAEPLQEGRHSVGARQEETLEDGLQVLCAGAPVETKRLQPNFGEKSHFWGLFVHLDPGVAFIDSTWWRSMRLPLTSGLVNDDTVSDRNFWVRKK